MEVDDLWDDEEDRQQFAKPMDIKEKLGFAIAHALGDGLVCISDSDCKEAVDTVERLEREKAKLQSKYEEVVGGFKRDLAEKLAQQRKKSERLEREPAEAKAERDNYACTGHRLALELECLLMDTSDKAVQSRWWDSAHKAMQEWQKQFPYNGSRLGM